MSIWDEATKMRRLREELGEPEPEMPKFDPVTDGRLEEIKKFLADPGWGWRSLSTDDIGPLVARIDALEERSNDA